MADSQPQVVVVGAGIRGSMFAETITQYGRARLAGVCDPDPGARERIRSTLGVPVYPDVQSMLADRPEPAGAIIASPDDSHLEPATLCLERGLDLLVEKPLATTSADAAAIARTADRLGRRVSVGFENRWNPRFTLAKEALADASPGRVLNQVISLNDTLFVPTSMLSWAARSSPAWFLMPHSLDIAMWLADTEPVTVFARGIRTVLPARGVDTWDAVSATFGMADGGMVTLNSSWVLSEAAPSVFDFHVQVQAENATLELDIAPSGVTRLDQQGARWLSTGVYRHRGRLRGIPIDMTTDWLDSLCGDDVDLPDAHHGAHVTAAIEAVHRSLVTGRPVDIPSDTAHPTHRSRS